MNSFKSLLIAIVVAAVLLGVYLMRNGDSGESTSAVGASGGARELVVPGFPLNDVAAFTISSADESVTLVSGDGGWSVEERQGYPADFDRVARLLKGVWNLEVVQDVAAGPEFFDRLGVVDPAESPDGEGAGMRLEFRDAAGEPLAVLLAGDNYYPDAQPTGPMGAMATGRYYRPAGSENVYLSTESLGTASADPAEWLLKDDFLEIDGIQAIQVDFADEGSQGWTVRRENEDDNFELVGLKDGENVDGTKLSQLKNLLSNASFEDVRPKEEDASEACPVTVVVRTFDGIEYTLGIGDVEGNARPVAITARAPGGLTQNRSAPGGDATLEAADGKKDAAAGEAAPEGDVGDDAETGPTDAEKLEKAKRLEARVYMIPQWQLNAVTGPRESLLQEVGEEAAATE